MGEIPKQSPHIKGTFHFNNLAREGIGKEKHHVYGAVARLACSEASSSTSAFVSSHCNRHRQFVMLLNKSFSLVTATFLWLQVLKLCPSLSFKLDPARETCAGEN